MPRKTKSNKRLSSVMTRKTNKCDKSPNHYNTFEDKVERLFIANGVDFTSTNYNLEKEILKDLKKAVSVTNIKPQNDFYSYINERWLNEDHLDDNQKYIIQIDDFRLIQDKVYRELINLITDYLKDHHTGEFADALRSYYHSCVRLNTTAQMQKHATDTVAKIDEIINAPDTSLWDMMAFTNSNEMVSWGSPIVWATTPDDKQPDTNRCYLDMPQMTLADINIYFDDGVDAKYKKRYLSRYMKYLNELFHFVFGEHHGYHVRDIYDCELQILDAMSGVPEGGTAKEKKQLREFADVGDSLYTAVTPAESTRILGLDWSAFARALGYETVPSFYVTYDAVYLSNISRALAEGDKWKSRQWRTYWVYLFIRQQARFTKTGGDIYFNFHGNFMRGQEKIVGDDIRPVYAMGYAFNTFLTNQYIEHYQNEDYINYVKMMAEDLKTVFIRIIGRNKWMQPKTKEMALKKLHHFNLTVGSPEILEKDPILPYVDDDIWHNLKLISTWRNRRFIQLEGKPAIDIPIIDWSQTPPKFISTQAYVVNAAYTPAQNGIYIPLGYIQKPFLDLDERGIEYNLAHIGFTIGHEMSHALDDFGSKYDHTGKLHDWWSPEDKRVFKRIQDDVIKQYETFASYDGVKFDAAASIGEDLADISGLTICREYLRDFQLKNGDILPIQTLSFQAFFVYFAFQQRQKLSKKSLEIQLKTNPHPPDKYRTNVPLSRLPIFRAIYDVKKGDKMWWHSTNRIWE